MRLKDGDPCPKCGNPVYEGIREGPWVVCLECRFEQVMG